MDKLKFAADFVEDLPSSAARSLENLRTEEVSAFVDQIPDSLSSKALQHMLPHRAALCLLALPVENSARYLANLPISNIAAILRHLPLTVRQDIIDALSRNVARRVRLLINFSRSVVGSWTNADAIALPSECTVRDALRRVREDASDTPADIFVVDQDHQLVGKVWIGSLTIEAPDAQIQEIMSPVAHSLSATTSIQAAINDIGWQHADVLPVVDRSNLFMGTLKHLVLRRAVTGFLADQRAPGGGNTGLAAADAWFSGLATILEAVVAKADEDGAGT